MKRRFEEIKKESNQNNHQHDCQQQAPFSSYVLIDGERFYNDRFYLNAPRGLPYYKHTKQQVYAKTQTLNQIDSNNADGKLLKREEGSEQHDGGSRSDRTANTSGSCSNNNNNNSNNSNQANKHNNSCKCKCQLSPPLFDRARLIQNLDLKAAIVGTYTLDPEWMSKEIPTLFPPLQSIDDGDLSHHSDKKNATSMYSKVDTGNDNEIERDNGDGDGHRHDDGHDNKNYIPTLILHGHQGLMNKILQKRQEKEQIIAKKKRTLSNSSTRTTRSNANLASSSSKGGEVICIDDNDESDNDNACYNDNVIKTVKRVPEEAPGLITKNYTTRTKKMCVSESQPKKKKRRKNDFAVKKLASKHRKKLFCEPTYDDTSTRSKNAFKGMNTNNRRNNGTGVRNRVNSSNSAASTSTKSGQHGEDNEKKNLKLFGNSVHVTQILPQWIPPEVPTSIDNKNQNNIKKKENNNNIGTRTSMTICMKNNNVIVIDSSSDEEKEAIKLEPVQAPSSKDKERKTNDQDPATSSTQRKKRCMGVFHPKFMLLFEKSGSVIVVVSTSNLTRPRAVDGTWLQRFYPYKHSGASLQYSSDKSNINQCDGSDFGFVLCDLLQKQTDAAEINEMTPMTFLKKYLNYSSLIEMQSKFAFHKANVHLVSTVPGSYPGRFGAHHLSKIHKAGEGRFNRRIFYGPQRVSDILYKCHHQKNPWLPSKLLSKSDKLIVQTTSFGANWSKRQFINMVRQYMGFDNPDESENHLNDLINQVDIVWPSKNLMDNIQNEMKKKCQEGNNGEDFDEAFEHFAFLTSDAFNLIDLECLSRMTKYEDQTASLIPYSLSPHIKTYARVMKNIKNTEYDSSRNMQQNKDSNLAWFMLTSACLSRGAQGHHEIKAKNARFEGLDEKNYLNFELGVLFCSRLQGNPSTDRLYKSFPNTSCSCESKFKVINLPIPYKVKSTPYQPNNDDADFDEDPFFHEISPKSVVRGNMALTPLGKKVRNTFSENQTDSRKIKSEIPQ